MAERLGPKNLEFALVRGRNSVWVLYSGGINARTVTSSTPVVGVFEKGQVLEFLTLGEGRGFVDFYNQNRVVSAENPLRLYSFQEGNWVEAPE